MLMMLFALLFSMRSEGLAHWLESKWEAQPAKLEQEKGGARD